MPDPITWYLQSRTIDDDQSILEAIDAKILTHNQDPSGHGQIGESVYGHRAEPEIDHPDGSVAFRKLSQDNILLSFSFDTLDGWQTAGENMVSVLNGYTGTDGTLNDEGYIFLWQETGDFKMDPAKNPYFQTTAMFHSNADQEAYIILGAQPAFGLDDTIGFKVTDGTLYAFWTKAGTEYTQEITGITLTVPNVFRVRVDSANEEIEFFVNGVIRYRANTNFPTVANFQWFTYYVKATAAAIKRIYLFDLYIEQDS